MIEAALAEASAVVCCWTESGVASRWVRTEADEGAARGILVPVMLDPVRISLAFRRIQAADLTDWEPGTEHAGFTELVRALERIVGPPHASEPDSPGEVTPAAAIPDGATVVGFCGSTDCRAATWVEIDTVPGIWLDVLAPPGAVPVVSRVSDAGLTLHRLTP